MIQEQKCSWLDKEYARINEFDYSCSNPFMIRINGNKGNILSDDLFELCDGCPIFEFLNGKNPRDIK